MVLNFSLYSTFHVLPQLLWAFFEAQGVVVPCPEVSEPEVAAPEVSEPEVVPAADVAAPGASEPEVVPAVGVFEPEVFEPGAVPVVGVSEPEVFEPGVVPVAGVSEPEVPCPEVSEPGPSRPEVVSVADVAGPEVSEPGLSRPDVAAPEASQPGLSELEIVSVADVAEPQASVDIAVPFAVLVPVSVVVIEADSSGRPKLLAFPNVDHYASSSSSVEVVGEESVHSSKGARTNYGFCSILYNLGLYQNKSSAQYYNNPSLGHSNVSYTSDLAIGATTNHSRNTSPHQYQEQRKHRSYRASLLHPEVSEKRWVVAKKQVLQTLQTLPAPQARQTLPAPVLELPLVSAAPVIDYSQSTYKSQETL